MANQQTTKTIRLSCRVHRGLKIAAASQEKGVNELGEEVVRNFLEGLADSRPDLAFVLGAPSLEGAKK